jgi:hypothetical protein
MVLVRTVPGVTDRVPTLWDGHAARPAWGSEWISFRMPETPGPGFPPLDIEVITFSHPPYLRREVCPPLRWSVLIVSSTKNPQALSMFSGRAHSEAIWVPPGKHAGVNAIRAAPQVPPQRFDRCGTRGALSLSRPPPSFASREAESLTQSRRAALVGSRRGCSTRGPQA